MGGPCIARRAASTRPWAQPEMHGPCPLIDPLRSGRYQPMRESVKATLDHPTVTVVPERADSCPAPFEVLSGSIEVAELAVALREVEVQRRIEAGNWALHADFSRPLLRDQVGSRQRPQVLKQLLAHVVLHVGHGVSKRGTVQRIAVVSNDIAPHLREQLARRVTFATLAQRHPFANAIHRCVWLTHGYLLAAVATGNVAARSSTPRPGTVHEACSMVITLVFPIWLKAAVGPRVAYRFRPATRRSRCPLQP